MTLDADLGVDPTWRHIVDQRLPEIIAMLEAQTGKDASLFIKVLLSNKEVIAYLQHFFHFSATGNIDDLYVSYSDWRVEHKNLFIDPSNINLSASEVFFLGALNFEDHVMKYMNGVISTNKNGEYWTWGTIDVLLAGAYFGGHNRLIELIKTRIKNIEDEAVIRYSGLIGAMCAGRYHYMTGESIEDITKNDVPSSGFGVLCEHLISTKDNISQFLSSPILPKQKSFNDVIYPIIFKSTDFDFKMWFLTSQFAQEMKIDNIPREGWLFIAAHSGEAKLSDDIKNELEYAKGGEFSVLIAVSTENTSRLKKLLKEGASNFPRYSIWAMKCGSPLALTVIMEYLRRHHLEAVVTNDPQVIEYAKFWAEGKFGEIDAFHQILNEYT